MLTLDSSRWAELEHAYGSASNIPALLAQLESFPTTKGEAEPWFSLWSALCHQEDVYSASFAAVPHIVRILASNPVLADFNFFQLPACIEIARARTNYPIPADLLKPYVDALQQFPALVGAAAARQWDATLLSSALSAIAAAKGFSTVARAALELDPPTAEEFMQWYFER